MKKLVLVFLLSSMVVPRVHAQSTNVPESIVGSAVAEITDELKREEQRRAEERKRIEEDLRIKEGALGRLKAESKEQSARVPQLERERTEAESALEASYAEMSRVRTEYDALAAKEKEKLSRELVGDLNDKHQREHREQLAAYKRDRAIVENYKWKMSDFDDMVLKMTDDAGGARSLVFKDQRKVSGEFPTMDLEVGRVVWHKVPPRSRFTVTMVSGNPFVADVLLKPGFSVAEFDTTNRIARYVHVFITKHFEEEKRDDDNPYELSAVSWYVDSEKSVCWQAGILPVFHPTPEPPEVPDVATVATPQIASVLDGWVWESPEWEQKTVSARDSYEEAKTELKNKVRAIPKAQAEVNMRLASILAKQTEIETEIEELKNILKEYDREDAADEFEDNFDADSGDGGGNMDEGTGGKEGDGGLEF